MAQSRMRAAGRTRIGAALIAAGLIGLAACSTPPMKYVPGAPVSSAPSKSRAAVAAVVDETRPTTSDDERQSGHQMFNFATYDGPTAWLSPQHISDILVSDLAASGLFAAVDREGAAPADVVVKPTLKQAWTTMGGISGDVWDFGLQVEVTRSGKTILSKLYKRSWKTGALGMDPEPLARNMQDVMNELRADLAKAL